MPDKTPTQAAAATARELAANLLSQGDDFRAAIAQGIALFIEEQGETIAKERLAFRGHLREGRAAFDEACNSWAKTQDKLRAVSIERDALAAEVLGGNVIPFPKRSRDAG